MMKFRSILAGLCAALFIEAAAASPASFTLAGNTRPEALPANDRGALPRETRLDHMQLLLQRAPQSEAALQAFIAALHDPNSRQYHHWLTAASFGAAFGPAETDIAAVTAWLAEQGFAVNGIAQGRMTIDFSGTAGQVSDSFETEIHRLSVNGVTHIANMSDPRIPARFAGIIAGIVSLHDFRPHTNFQPRAAYTFGNFLGNTEAVVPADLATIYDFKPLFAGGITGRGQTVAVIEDTDVYSLADWKTFRTTFGLASYKNGSVLQIHPAGSNACAAPGVVAGNEAEAELDAEWASAAAPGATIELAACADTTTVFGGLLALQNLLDRADPPPIVSISYGECEALNGATANAAYNATYEQADALGVSVFVAAGDEGAASCDAGQSVATHGIGVSGLASTPYNVAVGGTDFSDTYAGTTDTYWTTTNSATYGSAKSYVPEIPWNGSCASALLSSYIGYATPYGSSGFCNSFFGELFFLNIAAGSGGPSKCATGAAAVAGVVGGTCAGYAKPAWQALLGVPADGVRDIPDVSLFAASGAWSHYFVFCDSDTSDQGSACTGAPSGWSAAGGTSFASPILAGIQALVNQKAGSRQGNPNPVYYRLARAEYGRAGKPACTSGKGNAVGATCTFYDVTQGDMDVACQGNTACYLDRGTYGVLSLNHAKYLPSYGAATGWDFATGIGTLNANNLVKNW
jgi:subtilase family serine protease